MKATTEGNPDAYYLAQAIESIRNLQNVAQLRTFQTAMGKGPTGKWEWHDIVANEVREGLSKAEAKRQSYVCYLLFERFECLILCSIIFEMIKGEMAYVRDLENIDMVRRSFQLLGSTITHFTRMYRCTSSPCEKWILPSFLVTD
jgi:hypothetical protein